MSDVWKARPTVYKGILMRSRLEARFAASLDTIGDEWRYEPRAYANESGQYLPDFQVMPEGIPPDHPWFIEVKPTEETAYSATERMEIIWDSEPGAALSIFYLEDDEWTGLVAHGDYREWHRKCQH